VHSHMTHEDSSCWERPAQTFDTQIHLLSAIAVAEVLGVSRQRISQLQKRGRLPAPVAQLNGDRPLWLRQQFGPAADPATLRLVIERTVASDLEDRQDERNEPGAAG
jgi:predicted DNA-binding transcriptional regulator AlpA